MGYSGYYLVYLWQSGRDAELSNIYGRIRWLSSRFVNMIAQSILAAKLPGGSLSIFGKSTKPNDLLFYSKPIITVRYYNDKYASLSTLAMKKRAILPMKVSGSIIWNIFSISSYKHAKMQVNGIKAGTIENKSTLTLVRAPPLVATHVNARGIILPSYSVTAHGKS